MSPDFAVAAPTSAHSLKQAIAPLRQQLAHHPLYTRTQTLAHLRLFMEHHVFAVWDFMSLVKSLQRELTCTAVPWVPRGSAAVRYLINEIVLGEESDVDPQGNRLSHYELYLNAMAEAGADSQAITQLVAALQQGRPLAAALGENGGPLAARAFVNTTFQFINSGKPHVVAAVFTFGREDLIPDMFSALVQGLLVQHPELETFLYYLQRHIEVDGDHHSHLAFAMTEELCGTDPVKWAEAHAAVQLALQARLHLWNNIADQIATLN